MDLIGSREGAIVEGEFLRTRTGAGSISHRGGKQGGFGFGVGVGFGFGFGFGVGVGVGVGSALWPL